MTLLCIPTTWRRNAMNMTLQNHMYRKGILFFSSLLYSLRPTNNGISECKMVSLDQKTNTDLPH